MPPPSPPVALVTGGARRVGAAISQALLDAGYRVWVHYHGSAAHARAIEARFGPGRVRIIRADLYDEAARAGLCAQVTEATGPFGGRLDLLVNNAASFERGDFLSRTDADLRRVLELNFVAPVSLVRRLAPALSGTPAATDGADPNPGSVVHIVDLGALLPWPAYLDHCAAKAALANATRSLAVAVAPVRVNAVAPGTVSWPDDPAFAPGAKARTAIERAIPLHRAGRPEDVAKAVLYLAQAPYVNGEIHVVDGGRLAAAGIAR